MIGIEDFTSEQIKRIDEVYDEVRKLCEFLTNTEILPEMYLEVAENVAETLACKGYDVYFPYMGEDGFVHNYYKGDEK